MDPADPGRPPPPAPFDRALARERAELNRLLLDDGILYASDTQTVKSRDGTGARWMLETWPVSMSTRGGELSGQLLLALIEEHFESRQIATYGMTGIPLLQSVILASEGRCHGLVLRKERKQHGSSKLIEGRVDRSQPVVLLDDSVSSGTTQWEATRKLEELGLHVEGGVVLVSFDWTGGMHVMTANGKKMASVYDIFEDFLWRMPDEPDPTRNPTRTLRALDELDEDAPEGLLPSALARHVIERVLEEGKAPRPPRRMSGRWTTAGGCWVSLRDRGFIHRRHAREGFWRFPWEKRASAARDVVYAACQAALKLPSGSAGRRVLDESGIAVTTFSALEKVPVGGVDNDRYGLCVRSRARPAVMGGALPRMPGITTDWQQFRHAREKNGRLKPREPYEIYRHDVFKDVETTIEWQPTGVPRVGPSAGDPGWTSDAEVCGPFARRARFWACRALGVEAVDEGEVGAMPDDVDSVYLTLYVDGHLSGCMGGAVTPGVPVDGLLQKLAALAAADDRFQKRAPHRVAASISILRNKIALGRFTPDDVMNRVRLGEQALMAHKDGRAGILLPLVAATLDLGKAGFAREVMRKARLGEREPLEPEWVRWDADTWIADGQRARKMRGARPERPAPGRGLDELAADVAGFLSRQARPDGSVSFAYDPHRHQHAGGVDLPRFAYTAWVMARGSRAFAELREPAVALCEYLAGHQIVDNGSHSGSSGLVWLGGEGIDSTVSELSFWAMAELELARDGDALARAARAATTLAACVGPLGAVRTHRDLTRSGAGYQDYFAPQALLALGALANAEVRPLDDERVDALIRAQRIAWDAREPTGMVAWLPQALDAWDTARDDPRDAALAYRVVDHILDHQSERTGVFSTDQQPDGPGFTSALYGEGILAAALIAWRRDDLERYARYAAAAERGLRACEPLLLDDDDAAVLPAPHYARGAVLPAPLSCQVRVDFPAHTLASLLAWLGTPA
jgi:orotate phosphoribosyltransferase